MYMYFYAFFIFSTVKFQYTLWKINSFQLKKKWEIYYVVNIIITLSHVCFFVWIHEIQFLKYQVQQAEYNCTMLSQKRTVYIYTINTGDTLE